ncbi:MAG: ABC transporter ATP-binding protein [Beijerinckiaceae bacterium]|nr:ABC transporter ATP-binding protein [Beijerinckiaceae bacterium]MCZ8300955.1 ABC transporter ATP-binding protein [Beijerinckiaceae bacterium]
MADPILAFEDLTLGYDRHPAVHHLGGRIAPGTLLAIVGPNGGGKSTLLKGIAGRLAPLAGRIVNTFPHMAYMPQVGDLSRDFPVTVFDLALTGLCGRRGMFGRISRSERERAIEAIGLVGLSGFEQRSIRTLSGGQLQRLLFARLMLQDAPLILLDEPFTAIDQRTIDDLLEIVARWHGEGRTILAVLHDLELVRRNFPETLLLARDPLGWGPTPAVLTQDRLETARQMAEAFDRSAAECHRAA